MTRRYPLPPIVMIDDLRRVEVRPVSFGDWLWLGHYVFALALLTVFTGCLIRGVL